MADDLVSGSNADAGYGTIGAMHELHKGLGAFGLYSAVNNDSNAPYTFFTSPHVSTNPNTGIAASGKDSNGFGVGIKYNFSNKII